MAQLIPLTLTISCFSKIQIGFTFLVPADPGSSGKRAVKWVCVCIQAITAIGKLTAQVDWFGLRVGGHPALSVLSLSRRHRRKKFRLAAAAEKKFG